MVNLHVFGQGGREFGHLYSDSGDTEELRKAAMLVGVPGIFLQRPVNKLEHFDLWGRPLELAKARYNIVENKVFVSDMRRLRGE